MKKTRYNRKNMRLKTYDYTTRGAYFITICTKNKQCIFGDVTEGAVSLNSYGCIVEKCWLEIKNHFPNAETDYYVVMPNHIHGIIVLARATHASPLQEAGSGPKSHSIGAIIGSFKSAASKQINQVRGTPGVTIWQRNYYEHVIRDEDALNLTRQYITDNPFKWELDPENLAKQPFSH